MKTIYKSSDGNQFDSRRECKLYEDALWEVEKLVTNKAELQYEMVSGLKFYKINSYAELWLFDNTIATAPQKPNSKLYDLFRNIKDKKVRFPIWLREDAKASKKSAIEGLEKEMEDLKGRMDLITEEIGILSSLDSRSKSPIIESETFKEKVAEEIEEDIIETEEDEDNELSLIEVEDNEL